MHLSLHFDTAVLVKYRHKLSSLFLVCGMQSLQGAPNDRFLYTTCSENQKLPRIFYTLRKAKNFLMTVPLVHVQFSKLI